MKSLYFLFILHMFFSSVYASVNTLEKVTLQLQWKHQFEFAGFYAAKEKGFYDEVGLDVTFKEFNSDINLVDEVVEGRAEYALGYSSIVLDYMNNKPIVFLSNFFKQSPLVLVTQKDITSIAQLKGRKVEGLANNIHNITLFKMLSKFGVNGSDFHTVDPTFDIKLFLDKQVDAMSVFTTNEIFLLDEAGAEYNVFDPVSYGAKYYDVNLFTSQKEFQENPQRVKRFNDASIRGWEYALKHKEEIVELILKKYNSQNKTKESLMFEALQVENIMLPSVHEIGSIDIGRVKMIADSFIQSEFMRIKKVPNLDSFVWSNSMSKYTFTKEEKEYLKQKKNIKICTDPQWMPIEASIDGEYVGIGADYWKLFRQKMGVNIEVFKTESWEETLSAMGEKKCDVLSLSAPTKEREKKLYFTDSFLDLSLVIVTTLDKNNVLDFSLLNGKSIAVVKGYALIDVIRKKYPTITIVEVDNIQAGLHYVTDAKVFGFADSAVAIDYEYKNGYYKDFKVSAHFDEKLRLGLGVAKDDEILYSIMQKLIKNTTDEEKQVILRKWFSGTYASKFDYVLFMQISLFAGMIVLFFVYRHYAIKQLNKELKIRVEEELKKSFSKDQMIFHQSKLVAMGEMIENIAHQWRQPLSQVNSCILVIDDQLDEMGVKNTLIEKKMHEVEYLTLYMSQTIDDFRNFFRKDKLKKEIVIEEIVKKAIDILQGKIHLYRIAVQADFKDKHRYVTFSNELQQVFLVILNNAVDILLGNAIKNPKIEIEITKTNEEICINISDNGGGIQEVNIEKIFEPYYTTKHKSQGTGLGLYISKVIMEESIGGSIVVENKSEGACFSVVLKNEEKYR